MYYALSGSTSRSLFEAVVLAVSALRKAGGVEEAAGMGSRLEIETPSQLASVIGDIAVLIEQNVAARGRILISPSASAGLKLLSGTSAPMKRRLRLLLVNAGDDPPARNP